MNAEGLKLVRETLEGTATNVYAGAADQSVEDILAVDVLTRSPAAIINKLSEAALLASTVKQLESERPSLRLLIKSSGQGDLVRLTFIDDSSPNAPSF